MSESRFPNSSNAAMVRGWLTARSLVRGLPAPLDEGDGWRVETGAPDELRRYIFVEPTEGLRTLAHSIQQSRVLIKLFGSEQTMRPLLPPRWRFKPRAFFMTWDDMSGAPSVLPGGYEMAVAMRGSVVEAKICTKDGAVVAGGFAAETEDSFVYDRIVTDVSHRRRGLARAVMTTLAARRRSTGSRQVLVATEEGRALYSSMGWVTRSPWTTAAIPAAF